MIKKPWIFRPTVHPMGIRKMSQGTSCPSPSSVVPSPGYDVGCWRKRRPFASRWCARLGSSWIAGAMGEPLGNHINKYIVIITLYIKDYIYNTRYILYVLYIYIYILYIIYIIYMIYYNIIFIWHSICSIMYNNLHNIYCYIISFYIKYTLSCFFNKKKRWYIICYVYIINIYIYTHSKTFDQLHYTMGILL